MTSMHAQHAASGPTAAGSGLAVEVNGLLLSPDRTVFQAGQPTAFSFRILDQAGQPVTSFVEHERAMHLIVVRRDLSGFQHLHPTMRVDGTWTAALTLPTAGVWRAFADFATEIRALTLGVDLFVAGQFDPIDLPAPGRSSSADGYEVTIQPAGLASGEPTELAFRSPAAGGR